MNFIIGYLDNFMGKCTSKPNTSFQSVALHAVIINSTILKVYQDRKSKTHMYIFFKSETRYPFKIMDIPFLEEKLM